MKLFKNTNFSFSLRYYNNLWKKETSTYIVKILSKTAHPFSF